MKKIDNNSADLKKSERSKDGETTMPELQKKPTSIKAEAKKVVAKKSVVSPKAKEKKDITASVDVEKKPSIAVVRQVVAKPVIEPSVAKQPVVNQELTKKVEPRPLDKKTPVVQSEPIQSGQPAKAHQEVQPQRQQPQQNQQYRQKNQSRHYDQPRGHHQQRKSVNSHFVPLDKRPLEELLLGDLNILARRYGIIGAGFLNKDALRERIKEVQLNPDMEMEVKGVLEKLPDGFGFLRTAQYDYVSSQDDVYVSPSQIRRFSLRTGDTVTGVIRKPKEGEKYFALLKIKDVNGEDPLSMADRPAFDRLHPVHPYKKFNLEYDPTSISTRIMDIFTPIGKGQRGMIVAPPKVGKTMVMKDLVKAMLTNHPEAHVIILLVDERPEEVADMKRMVKDRKGAEVVSSTFDESTERHVQVAELVLEKAKRMVESGKDVVILLDSITRLARAYNSTAPASGKILTGGVDANALQWPKRFFGAARATEEGGSLTILASALVDTGSRMDEVIYEEFKGTGNMEINMIRKLSNRRIYPPFDLMTSSTRREDLLQSAETLNKVWVLQKFLGTMNTIEGMEFLIDKMKKHKTNDDFLESINKKSNSSS